MADRIPVHTVRTPRTTHARQPMIELLPEAQQQAVSSLRRFCTEELYVELSELQARQFLAFLLKEIAPTACNAGVTSAEAYLRDRVANLEGVCHVPEFAYWPKGSSVRRK